MRAFARPTVPSRRKWTLFFFRAAVYNGFILEKRGGINMAQRGRFIVFEGLDGSGKSTQLRLLEQRLLVLGRRVFRTAEPTDGDVGRYLREALSGEKPCSTAQLAALFLADRIAHNEEIAAHLDAGEDVICDRYYYSSLAYQGPGTDPGWVADMNRRCPAIMKPDLCVFLDVDYRRCKARLDAGRDALEIYERDLGFMEATRNAFLAVFRRYEDEDRIAIVDADRDRDAVAEEIFAVVKGIL